MDQETKWHKENHLCNFSSDMGIFFLCVNQSLDTRNRNYLRDFIARLCQNLILFRKVTQHIFM